MKVIIKDDSLGKLFKADIILDVDPSETIESIKAKLQEATAITMEFAPGKYQLFVPLQQMDDNSRTLSDFLPKDELRLTLLHPSRRAEPGVQDHQKPADEEAEKKGSDQSLTTMKITFSSLTGKVFTLDFEPSDTIESVKAKIQDPLGFPAKDQSFVYNRKELEDGQTLADYNIQDGSTICVRFGAMIRGWRDRVGATSEKS